MQSPSEEQVVRHEVSAQAKVPQGEGAPMVHDPWPLQ
jgi:hypothetical protein